jgi:long-chain acyl-CoA synthetase
MLAGDGRPYPVALISPNWDLLRAELGLEGSVPIDDLVERRDVAAFLAKEVHRNTLDLAKYEQVRKVIVLPRELSIESGELSPTLKVKRRVVEARYGRQIERLYADSHPVATTA